MSTKDVLGAIFAALLLGWGFFSNTQYVTFSSTMEWGKEYAAVRDSPFRFSVFEDWEAHIKLPPPPANDSAETRAELNTLLGYQEERTGGRIADIRAQVDTPLVHNWEYIAQYGDPVRFPATSALNNLFHDVQKITFMLKNRFNRVRPSLLEPGLDPVVAVPNHPAYPSGHATEARLISLLFSELDPKHRDTYFAYADEVAVNREWGGVHYPSDSAAGKLLADQLFALLMEDEAFRDLLKKAKAEWHTAP